MSAVELSQRRYAVLRDLNSPDLDLAGFAVDVDGGMRCFWLLDLGLKTFFDRPFDDALGSLSRSFLVSDVQPPYADEGTAVAVASPPTEENK